MQILSDDEHKKEYYRSADSEFRSVNDHRVQTSDKKCQAGDDKTLFLCTNFGTNCQLLFCTANAIIFSFCSCSAFAGADFLLALIIKGALTLCNIVSIQEIPH